MAAIVRARLSRSLVSQLLAASRSFSLRLTLQRRLSTTPASEAAAAFRQHGHLRAKLDPLGLMRVDEATDHLLAQAEASLDEGTRAALLAAYCGQIGSETAHLESAEERAWWANALETASPGLTPAERRNAHVFLQKADVFEAFLGKKRPGFKRYSGEGTEGSLLAADAVFAAAAAAGVADVVVGQAHRGRLALLMELGYPPRKLLSKIEGNDDFPAAQPGVDDVSSHAFISVERRYAGGRTRVSLLPNPSHLEAINPVAAGKVRAKRDSGSSPSALCVILHGDAAVSGQGVVAETFQMADLIGYTIGGTVHVISNNQVGYTAEGAVAGRSSRYASDVAKVVAAPVLHVNGEDTEALVRAARLAVAYRTAFGKDVVLDVIGYRRHGHNEVDEPRFTNPTMYAAVTGRPSFADTYANALVARGEVSRESIAGLRSKLEEHLNAELVAARTTFTAASGTIGADATRTAFGGSWGAMRQATTEELDSSPPTGVAIEVLRSIAAASVAVPPGFVVHDRLVRGHSKPRLALASPDASPAGAPLIDWSTAEALAFGSLLLEGNTVRLSGQDVERGTFSQRHAVFVDQESGAKHTPLTLAGPAGSPPLPFFPSSSNLSEFAVMGFELGYSWDDPRALVLWEAQFGDFVNGAQIIIDQFLTGSESKWMRSTGLTLLLPHGFDGAGPEHSSARIERFLQAVNSQGWAGAGGNGGVGAGDKCAVEPLNMLVAIPTTPANYFHLLRRQQARPFRKPLVIFTPKTLLRAAVATSSLEDLGPGTAFASVLHDVYPAGAETPVANGFVFDSRLASDAARVERTLLVCGKVYSELARRRAEVVAAGGAGAGAASRTAIVRVEELAPWPAAALEAVLSSFPALKSVEWVQEEPANAGAWTWASAHLSLRAGGASVRLLARPALPTPAVGMGKRNKAQQDALLAAALPS